MDHLKKHLQQICIPTAAQPIYKDECMYTYDTAESAGGLYLCLSTFLGFGAAYVRRYAEKTGKLVFLHIRTKKTKKETAVADDVTGPERKITRLAIGIEGGYNDVHQSAKYEYNTSYSIVVAPNWDAELAYPSAELPLLVTQCVEAVLAADSANKQLEKQALVGTWDGEARQVSKYAQELVQLANGKKIPPSGWKCEQCDLTTNLWLNLTDGAILCGRKFFDGSGGNDHAVQHYQQKRFPLAVKLGTISPDGKTDVYSYAEDDMVIDPKLEEHLAHFGINMTAMKKSEKSMVELELEINQRIGEWSLLTESESALVPLAGPGYTGMRNLGNSCYINSVMQVLFHIPDFKQRFVGSHAERYFEQFPQDPANDFNIQMAKLGNGLWSGAYSRIPENALDSEFETGIAPIMFKHVMGKNHADFSTKQQQDAYDFYLHMLNLLEKHSRHEANPVDALSFTLEERVECTSSQRVKYTQRTEYCLPLQIPLDKAINKRQVEEYLQRKAQSTCTDEDVVRPQVPLQACLEGFFAAEIIEQFYSSAIKGNTLAKKSTRLASMPDFLMIHLRKFTLGDDWVPKKLDVCVQMPDHIDIEQWRAQGLQPEEQLLPETEPAQQKFVYDKHVMSELMLMGFPEDACKRALYHTANGGLELASNWLMEHLADADFADPFIEPASMQAALAQKMAALKPESVAMLMSMGFDERQATKALLATDGNLERATDWILSHADEMDTDELAAATASSPAIKQKRDGLGKYELVAFISHMGGSAQVGHYVCHIRKNGNWVIYNDSKVALSQNPPKDLGYLYLYERKQ